MSRWLRGAVVGDTGAASLRPGSASVLKPVTGQPLPLSTVAESTSAAPSKTLVTRRRCRAVIQAGECKAIQARAPVAVAPAVIAPIAH